MVLYSSTSSSFFSISISNSSSGSSRSGIPPPPTSSNNSRRYCRRRRLSSSTCSSTVYSSATIMRYVVGSLCYLAFMEGSSSGIGSCIHMMTVSVSAAAAATTARHDRRSNSQQRLGSLHHHHHHHHLEDEAEDSLARLIQDEQQQPQPQPQRALQQHHHHHRERISLVQRLYGPDNADVRRNVLELQERLERSQTGFNGDVNHIVPYKNHPFDVMERQRQQRRRQRAAAAARRRRRLQDTDDSTIPEEDGTDDNNNNNMDTSSNTVSSIANSLFRPIRIHFETKALDDIRDEENAAKIEWYKKVILPKTAAFWQEALSVVPVSDRLLISTAELDQRQYCGDSEFTLVPNDYLQYGMENTDLILFVSGSASERFCQSRTLAVAVACNFDQYDRPTAGAINVCLDNIILESDGTATDSVVQDYVDVSIHEVGHVLGHSSNSYRFFYDPDTGTPRTTRPFSARTVTCVDGTERSQILPGPTTITFGARNNGATRYASIVTPKVRTVARNQFNCPTLEGAPLENQPTRSDSCAGDHWDERLFYPEAMSGVISPTTNILSSLTLALMEDSGWYVANYTSSRMSPWGLGVGCEFVEQPCLIGQGWSTTTTTTTTTNTTTAAAAQTEAEDGGEGRRAAETVLESTGLSSLASSINTEDAPALPDYSRGFFCNRDGDRACSSELTHKLACSVIDYSFLAGQESPPVEAQFFDNSNLGGPRQADFCPVYGTTYDNKKADALDCRDPNNNPTGFVNSYEEVYGPDSRCLPSSSGEGRCYFSACVASDMTFRFIVGGKWYICEEDFQELSVSSFLEGVPHTVTCPRLTQACPDLFCPFNCAGRGICNYENVVNGTIKPRCECFDSSDTSRGCSESQIPDGGYLDDGSGLLDNIEENFFDPLVAVFVDHPDKWTTASWAWAAGLVSICIILLLCICSSFWPQKGYSPYSKREGLSSSHYRRPLER